jgi:hypothetical protein
MRRLKIFLIIAGLLWAPITFSQVKMRLFASAGVNSTNVNVVETRYKQDKYQGKWSWQAGGQLEFILPDSYILFIGMNAWSYNYIRDVLSFADARFYNDYKLVFLNLPGGLGYHWQIDREAEVNFYVGAYFNMGIGGSANNLHQGFYPTYTEWKKKDGIKFTKTSGENNFHRINWGFQPGISIGFLQKVQLAFNYQVGKSNILPKEDREYEVLKLRSFSIGVKYQILSKTIGSSGQKTF